MKLWRVLLLALTLALPSVGRAATDAAILCMALNVYHEGLKDEPIEGLFAIAQVTLNRAERKPERVCSVVQARAQFSWTLKPPPVEDGRPWRNAQAVARLSLHMADFTGGATHYHALYIAPYWKADMEPLGQWGNHVFYRRKGKA
jgi:spore germination cell wall hydrolase CwlJ-like protein